MLTLDDIANSYISPQAIKEPRVRKGKAPRKLAVIDFETDPFKFGRVPEPFCVEFYTDEISEYFWGPDCADQLADFLEKLPDKYLIYAHNGGKFDAYFLMKYIDNPALIIKTRIVECKLFQHTLRDSYAIIPGPLRDYEKMEFEYWKMEDTCREQYREDILEYLHSDCVNLYKLVTSFVQTHGTAMTIGGAAMKMITKHHEFKKCGAEHDKMFRQYFYGGRVQKYRSGLIKGPIKLFDVNGMYTSVMKNTQHPINGAFAYSNSMPDNFDVPFFITFEGTNNNALPSYDEDGSLIFTKQEGVFKACSHELEVALEHGLVTVDKVHSCYIATETINFKEFIDIASTGKETAKRDGDKPGYIVWKYTGNAGYGRFTINPENFADWLIFRDFGNEAELFAQGYTQQADYETLELWSRPTTISDENYCDVAIGASITSAARALLLRALQNSVNPYYCDTDSIMCEDFHGDIDEYRLGAWDLEKTTDNVAIYAKKGYAMYDDGDLEKFIGTSKVHNGLRCNKCRLPIKDKYKHRDHELNCNVKMASKGGLLTLAEIVEIANGGEVHYDNDAPTFSLKHDPRFVTRTFRTTG